MDGKSDIYIRRNILDNKYKYDDNDDDLGFLKGLVRKTYFAPSGTSGRTAIWQKYEITRDGFGNPTIIRVHGSTDGQNWTESRRLATYTYQNNNGLLSQMKYGNNDYINYTYEIFDRVTKQTYNDGGEYEYVSGTVIKIKIYSYDTGGNLTSVNDGSTTHTYTYGSGTWIDLLTKYDGHSLSYSGIGNPLTYYNGSSYTMTWEKGRRLATMTKDNTTTTFTYDIDGIRLSKKTGGVTTKFVTEGGQVKQMTWSGNVMTFFYDTQGRPYAMTYKSSGSDTYSRYYYVLNLQGDVVAILDSTGAPKGYYTYDAWGNLESVKNGSGTEISSTNMNYLVNLNPLRYRESGFYYLQSRYYDPKIGRFINADGQIGIDFEGGLNLFAYCGNNLVNRYDPTGEFAIVDDFLFWGGLFAISVMAITIPIATPTPIVSRLPEIRTPTKSVSDYILQNNAGDGISEHTNGSKNWDKHTNPRPGRTTTKNRSKPGWKDNPNKKNRNKITMEVK